MAPVDDHQVELTSITRLAIRSLLDALSVASFEQAAQAAALEALEESFTSIIEFFGEQAAMSAVRFLELDRDEAGFQSLPDVLPAAPPTLEQVRASLDWGLQPLAVQDRAAARQRLGGSVQRLVRQPARETIYDATERAGTRFARVPTGVETCEFCLMLASRGAVYDEETVLTTTGRSTATSGRPAGLRFHDNCVVPGTWVSGPETVTGYRRYFEGEVVTLVTAAGHQLTVTPKHPILTDRGWVPSGMLNPGDQLVSTLNSERCVVSGPDVDHVPARIEDVVGALGVMLSSTGNRVPGSAEQFHGDGFDSEVHVVHGDHLFRDELNTAFIQQRAQAQFQIAPIPRPLSRSARSGPGKGDVLRTAPRARTSRLMGVAGQGRYLVRGELGHAELARRAMRTKLDPSLLEPSADHRTGNAVGVGQSKDALAVGITTGYVGGSLNPANLIPPVTRKFDPSLDYGDSDGRLMFAEYGADLLVRLSGAVKLDRLVDKRVGVHHGDVLNLETQEGWYSANSIIASNCDCLSIEVRTDDELPEINRRLDDLWQENAASDFNVWKQYLAENPFTLADE